MMKVSVFVCVCERERERESICLLISICSTCLFNSPFYHFLKYVCASGGKCQALVLLCLTGDYDLKGVCCSGRGSPLTQG